MVRTNERYAEYQADGDQVDGPKAVQEAMGIGTGTGPQGPIGPPGPQGPQGIQGIQGDPGDSANLTSATLIATVQGMNFNEKAAVLDALGARRTLDRLGRPRRLSGTTVRNVIYSTLLPAGSLRNRTLSVYATFDFTASANSKRCEIIIGTAPIGNRALLDATHTNAAHLSDVALVEVQGMGSRDMFTSPYSGNNTYGAYMSAGKPGVVRIDDSTDLVVQAVGTLAVATEEIFLRTWRITLED